MAHAGRDGRRMLAQAAGVGRAADGSIAGVRGPRAVRWVHAAAAVKSLAGAYPCARLVSILPCGLYFTDLT